MKSIGYAVVVFCGLWLAFAVLGNIAWFLELPYSLGLPLCLIGVWAGSLMAVLGFCCFLGTLADADR